MQNLLLCAFTCPGCHKHPLAALQDAETNSECQCLKFLGMPFGALRGEFYVQAYIYVYNIHISVYILSTLCISTVQKSWHCVVERLRSGSMVVDRQVKRTSGVPEVLDTSRGATALPSPDDTEWPSWSSGKASQGQNTSNPSCRLSLETASVASPAHQHVRVSLYSCQRIVAAYRHMHVWAASTLAMVHISGRRNCRCATSLC